VNAAAAVDEAMAEAVVEAADFFSVAALVGFASKKAPSILKTLGSCGIF
jgi:hypothetical protein